jgi:hypothetical protein
MLTYKSVIKNHTPYVNVKAALPETRNHFWPRPKNAKRSASFHHPFHHYDQSLNNLDNTTTNGESCTIRRDFALPKILHPIFDLKGLVD